jgi:hypothetical protein
LSLIIKILINIIHRKLKYNIFYWNNIRSHNLNYLVTRKDKFLSLKRINVRSFSTSKNNGSSTSTDSLSLVVFSNADKDKLDILDYVKGKSGIYMWTNKLNDKIYREFYEFKA